MKKVKNISLAQTGNIMDEQQMNANVNWPTFDDLTNNDRAIDKLLNTLPAKNKKNELLESNKIDKNEK